MNPYQPTSFNSVDEFLDVLPENELEIIQELRNLIFSSIPDIDEYLAYNVPFYRMNKRLFYIWPASVPWGKVPERSVILGFIKGYLMEDPYNLLEDTDRKYVRVLKLSVNQTLDTDLIKYYLYEALTLDSVTK